MVISFDKRKTITRMTIQNNPKSPILQGVPEFKEYEHCRDPLLNDTHLDHDTMEDDIVFDYDCDTRNFILGKQGDLWALALFVFYVVVFSFYFLPLVATSLCSLSSFFLYMFMMNFISCNCQGAIFRGSLESPSSWSYTINIIFFALLEPNVSRCHANSIYKKLNFSN